MNWQASNTKKQRVDWRLEIKLGIMAAAMGLLALGNQAMAVSISVAVATGADDAEENVASGGMSLGSSDLELGADGGGSNVQIVGMRFLGIGIPAGSTIDSATIQFADRGEPVPESMITQ